MAGRKLTPKQESFCIKFVECGNASDAYRFAYDCGKMKSATVNRNAKANLENNKIATRIKGLQKETADTLLVSPESVLREHARIAFSDVRKIFKENGILKSVDELDDNTAAAVASVKFVTRGLGEGEVEHTTELKFWPKTQALDSLSKNLGLYEKHNEQKNPLEKMSTEKLEGLVEALLAKQSNG